MLRFSLCVILLPDRCHLLMLHIYKNHFSFDYVIIDKWLLWICVQYVMDNLVDSHELCTSDKLLRTKTNFYKNKNEYKTSGKKYKKNVIFFITYSTLFL